MTKHLREVGDVDIVAMGGRLARARDAAGLTQAQVARLLDIPRPSVSEIEKGKRRVKANELYKLSATYGVGTDWILHGALSVESEERVEVAARELASLRSEDLDRVIDLLQTLRRTK